jgi:hypothetical protein
MHGFENVLGDLSVFFHLITKKALDKVL